MKQEEKAYFQKMLKDQTIIVNIPHVAKSGMSRNMTFYVVTGKRLSHITSDVAIILNEKYNPRKDIIRVQGCGMDMVYHTIEKIGKALDIPMPVYQVI